MIVKNTRVAWAKVCVHEADRARAIEVLDRGRTRCRSRAAATSRGMAPDT